jgi:hypothetical protein
LTYWFQNYIERREENENGRAVNEEAGNDDAKLRFVRNDVPGSFDRIARDDKRVEQHIVAEHHDGH